MVAIKQEVQNMIQNLPDNCTYEDIQYHLYVVKKIKNGMNRAKKVRLHLTKMPKREWLSGYPIRMV